MLTGLKQTMESHLTRARSSLHVSTPSRSSLGSDSTPSPPFKRASTATYIRDTEPSSPTSPKHSRFASEDTNGLAPAPRIGTQRSASALGVAGGYRRPLNPSRSEDQIRNSLAGQPIQRTSSLLRNDLGLTPLTEDAADTNGPASEDGNSSAKLNRFLSPTFGTFGDNTNGQPLQRSASVAQMRDIKDQMKDLKGRLSSLREQARSDSMKRRSLQSLRTPSPFTHAQVDQWYAKPETSVLSSEIGSATGSVGRSPWNGDAETVDYQGPAAVGELNEQSEEEGESVYSEIENSTQLRPPGTQSPERKPAEPASSSEPGFVDVIEEDDDDGISDMHTENGDFVDEDEVGDDTALLDEEAYYSESGESLYEDAVQHPISHEDREDAFDYEHFFLHSAMGTISQQRLGRRDSRESFASEDSVVTQRAINDPEPARSDGSTSPPPMKARRNSDASISTVGTFATATEGSGGISPLEQEPGRRSKEPTSRPVSRKSRPGSPDSVRRITFAPSTADHTSSRPSTAITRHSIASFTSIPEEDGKENTDPYANFHPRVSVNRRPMSSSAMTSMHRPSVSSMESTGTTRSFPLVNRPKKANSIGVLTPQNSSPDQELKALSDSLLNETASICEQQAQERRSAVDLKFDGEEAGEQTKTPQAMQVLLREDQYLVERLVANLGRCVLGLTESGKASPESRMYRRRIDAARRILEGLDQV
ncbi:hypothetical protein GE09DRAFT_1148189 [Coniochaeta sp. 2T2.1]|nr:hypothetical protein GE09DRAFT_1148189 [Coniochaeta sp. 2T2.1]